MTAALLLLGATHLACAFSGLHDRNLRGRLEVNPTYLYALTPASPVSPPEAPLVRVGKAPEFWADLDDTFQHHWRVTCDFQDNYQLRVKATSPTPQANLAAGAWMVKWHFYDLPFEVAEVRVLASPEVYWDWAQVSFDAHNIWIDLVGLDELTDRSAYTFQIVPVPEPASVGLLALGLSFTLARRRRAGRTG